MILHRNIKAGNNDFSAFSVSKQHFMRFGKRTGDVAGFGCNVGIPGKNSSNPAL